MKTFLSRVGALALMVLVLSCSEESPESAEKQRIQFSFSVSSSSTGGRTQGALPGGSKVHVTLTTPSGTPVLTNHEIAILSFGDDYITEPLELSGGQYKITDFLIVHDGEVLFATPKYGSPMAGAVSHSLPYSFSVSKNQVSNVALDVLDATKSTPAAFGYVSFGINVIEHPLPISIFRKSGEGLKLTDATLYIYENDVEMQVAQLGAKLNYVAFEGEPDGWYRLVVKKDGYVEYGTEFSFSHDNPFGVGNGPLNIILEPSADALHYFDEGDFTKLGFREAGQIRIYRAEKFETFNFAANSSQWLFHWYLTTNDRDVSITGDLDKIVSFTQFNSSRVDLHNLVKLEELVLEQTFYPGPLDLSSNTKLRTLNLYAVNELLLPISHEINTIIITDGTTNFEGILDNVYTNAVSKNITSGSVTLNAVYPDSLSPQILSLLDSLQTLGWVITYSE
jgi:hypothetical protein